MNKLRKDVHLISLALLVNPALAQIEHGSIGVTYYTQDKISMAADGRGITTIGTKRTPNNDGCKVGTLDRHTIFNVTGMLGYTPSSPNDPVKSWKSMSDAHRAASAYPTKDGHVKEIADGWGDLVRKDAMSVYLNYPDSIISLAKSQMGGIATGTFGGFDISRQLVLFVTKIRFDRSKSMPISFETGQFRCVPHNFCASGLVEIFTEFDNDTSQRARDERRTWIPASPFDLRDYDLLRTIRFVELAEMYRKGDEIGGKIDSAELQRSGLLRWHDRKTNCPEN
jgi:hypothetical protein